MSKRAWSGKTQGGTLGQMSIMLFLRYIGIRPLYVILACVVPFYMIFSRGNRKNIEAYLQRRLGPLSRWHLVRLCYKNHYYFAQAMVDRFAMLTGLRHRYCLQSILGEPALKAVLKGEKGFILAGAHLGNMELAGYFFDKHDKQFNGIVFGAEAAFLQKHRTRALAEQKLRLIPVAEDLSHIFALHQALREGECLTLHCDRNMLGNKKINLPFLGASAGFPTGAFHLALRMDVPVLALFVMREKNKTYSIHIKNLTQSLPSEGSHEDFIRQYVQSYINELEVITRRYPEQWYNYHDFWKAA